MEEGRGRGKEEGRPCSSFGQGVPLRDQWVTPEQGEDPRDKFLMEPGSIMGTRRNLLPGNSVAEVEQRTDRTGRKKDHLIAQVFTVRGAWALLSVSLGLRSHHGQYLGCTLQLSLNFFLISILLSYNSQIKL